MFFMRERGRPPPLCGKSVSRWRGGGSEFPQGEQHCGERPDRVSRKPANATTGCSGRSAAEQGKRSVSGPGWAANEAGLRSDAGQRRRRRLRRRSGEVSQSHASDSPWSGEEDLQSGQAARADGRPCT